jgi:heat shock protein HspQ
MSHKFEIGQTVKHKELDMEGIIVDYTTLGEVVDGDCEDDEMDQPWYVIDWVGEFTLGEFSGQESEDSLELV